MRCMHATFLCQIASYSIRLIRKKTLLFQWNKKGGKVRTMTSQVTVKKSEKKEPIDSICQCGHSQSDHTRTAYDSAGIAHPSPRGLGACKFFSLANYKTYKKQVCECRQFTWADYIYADDSKTVQLGDEVKDA